MERPHKPAFLLVLAGITLAALGLWVFSSPDGQGLGSTPDSVNSQGAIDQDSELHVDAGEELSSELSRQAMGTAEEPVAATASLRVELLYIDGEPGSDLLVKVEPESLGRDLPSMKRIVKRSDEQGVIEFENLSDGQYRVHVLHPGAFEVVELAAGQQTLHRVQFRRGLLLSGEVLDLRGGPVPAAEIWTEGSVGLKPVAVSDAQGKFQLRAIRDRFVIGATADGYAPSPLRQIQGAPDSEVSVQLVLKGRGGAVRGVVLSAQGEPVEGAEVTFPNRRLVWEQLADERVKRVTEVRVTTNAAGLFFARGLPPLELPLIVRAEGHGAIAETVEVYSGGTREVTLRMTGTGALHGRVRNESGEGYPDVNLSVTSNQWGVMAQGKSDSEGSFRFANLSLGEIYIHYFVGRKSHWEELSLSEGEALEHDLIVPSGAEIAGRVVDSRDQPLAGWSVSADKYRSTGGLVFAETDTDGKFLLEHLNPDSSYVLTFMSPDKGWPPNHRLTGVRAEGRKLFVRIPDDALLRGSIQGRVLDADGKPFVNPRVSAMHMGIESAVMAEFGEGGAFLASSLPAGEFKLSISLGAQRVHIQVPDLGPGENLDLGLIQAEAVGRLTVNFVSPAGANAERVIFLDEKHQWIGGVDLVGGKLEDYAIIPGSHLMHALGPQLNSSVLPIQIRSGEHSRIEVVLESGVPCEFSFTFAEEEALPTRLLELRVRDAAGKLLVAEALGNIQGQFKSRRPTPLPAGTYTLEAVCRTGVSARGEFEITAEESEPRLLSYELR